MSRPQYRIGAVPLNEGRVTAVWRQNAAEASVRMLRDFSSLTIMQAALIDEGVYGPAASIYIGGRESLLALRGAVDEALKEFE